MLYRGYQNEKIEELKNSKNYHMMSKNTLRALNKIIGRENMPKL